MTDGREISAAVLEELRRGVRSTSELAEATGLTRNAVACAIRHAREHGYRIVNLRHTGGHHDGLYQLAHDPENPQPRVCAAPGCRTHLSASNPTPYCRPHLAQAAYLVYLERLSETLDELLGVSEHEQLAMLDPAPSAA